MWFYYAGNASPSCIQGFAVEGLANLPAYSSAYVMAFSTVLRRRYGWHERFGGVVTRPKGGEAEREPGVVHGRVRQDWSHVARMAQLVLLPRVHWNQKVPWRG